MFFYYILQKVPNKGQHTGVNKIIASSREELMCIQDIGLITAECVYNYFKQPQHIDIIKSLRGFGLNFNYREEGVESNTFADMVFVLTGTLPTLSREEVTIIILRHNGKISSSVSKKTSYVLAGSEAGSKLHKAKELVCRLSARVNFFQ